MSREKPYGKGTLTNAEYHKTYYSQHREVLSARNRAWAKAHPERYKAMVLKHQVKMRYGIEMVEYLAIHAKPCAICKTKKDICVDHCAVTKKIRGALCRKCNSALGLFKHDPKLLRRAADYLVEAKAGPSWGRLEKIK